MPGKRKKAVVEVFRELSAERHVIRSRQDNRGARAENRGARSVRPMSTPNQVMAGHVNLRLQAVCSLLSLMHALCAAARQPVKDTAIRKIAGNLARSMYRINSLFCTCFHRELSEPVEAAEAAQKATRAAQHCSRRIAHMAEQRAAERALLPGLLSKQRQLFSVLANTIVLSRL